MTPAVSTATAGIRVDSPLQGRAAFSADGAFFGSVARSLDAALNQLVVGTGQALVNGKPAPSPAMNEATALAVLKNNMSQIADPATGTLSADDLLRVANGIGDHGMPATWKELEPIKSAARFFLHHPQAFLSLDTADGRLHDDQAKARPDGVITAEDLTSKQELLARKLDPNRMTDAKAVKSLTENLSFVANPKTGSIDANDLMRAAQGQLPDGMKVSPERLDQIKKAAQFYLNNPRLFKALETADGRLHGDKGQAKSDGIVTVGDLVSKQVLLDRNHARPQPAPVNAQQAAEIMMANPSCFIDPRTGGLTASFLMSAAQGKLPDGVTVSPQTHAEIESAARFILGKMADEDLRQNSGGVYATGPVAGQDVWPPAEAGNVLQALQERQLLFQLTDPGSTLAMREVANVQLMHMLDAAAGLTPANLNGLGVSSTIAPVNQYSDISNGEAAFLAGHRTQVR